MDAGEKIEVDIAVVGGGIAGCFTAFRLSHTLPHESPLLDNLAEQNPDGRPSVFLYEKEMRVGGRLYTNRTALPGVPIELGGTGICIPPEKDNNHPEKDNNPRGHARVARLLKYLGLTCKPFLPPNGENLYKVRLGNFTTRELENLASERGSNLRQSSSLKQSSSLTDDEWKNLSNLLGYVFEQIVPGITKFSDKELEEVRKSGKWKGKFLYEWSMGEALEELLSCDALNFIYDTTPLRSNIKSINLAEGMTSLLRSEMAGLQTVFVKEGYDSVCLRLADRLGSAVHKGWTLEKIEDYEGGKLALRFNVQRPTDNARDTDSPGGSTVDSQAIVIAKHVVLALPQSPLKALVASGGVFELKAAAQFNEDMNAVEAVSALMMHGIYPYPWWRRRGIVGGTSISTEWLRQLWPLHTRGEVVDEEDLRDDQQSHMLFAWKDGVVGNYMINVEAELKKFFDLDYIPQPIGEGYTSMLWEGGAFHQWLPGRRSWEVAQRMLQPIQDRNIYVCGEAYSEVQGWVEGALMSAEQLLRSKFMIERPEELSSWFR